MLTGLHKLNKKAFRFITRRIYSSYLYTVKTKKRYKLLANNEYAIINLDDQFVNYDRGRYAFILGKFFSYSGYNIIIKANKKFFERVSRYKKPLLKEKFSFVRSGSTPSNSIVIVTPNQSEKIIKLSYGYHIEKFQEHDCIAPYPLHPNFYKEYPSPKLFASLRESKRVMQIFFAGNVSSKVYGNDEVEREFHMINRVHLINFIKEQFKDNQALQVIADKGVLAQLLEKTNNTASIVISEVKTDISEWLPLLSKSSFFLCPPGAIMPWCHNLIESMSVGTIPILQYAHLCFPPLEHMKNCLAFSDLEELKKILETALTMKTDDIERMRTNVIDYYNKFLSLESIKSRIENFAHSNQTAIEVAVPYIKRESI